MQGPQAQEGSAICALFIELVDRIPRRFQLLVRGRLVRELPRQRRRLPDGRYLRDL